MGRNERHRVDERQGHWGLPGQNSPELPVTARHLQKNDRNKHRQTYFQIRFEWLSFALLGQWLIHSVAISRRKHFIWKSRTVSLFFYSWDRKIRCFIGRNRRILKYFSFNRRLFWQMLAKLHEGCRSLVLNSAKLFNNIYNYSIGMRIKLLSKKEKELLRGIRHSSNPGLFLYNFYDADMRKDMERIEDY